MAVAQGSRQLLLLQVHHTHDVGQLVFVRLLAFAKQVLLLGHAHLGKEYPAHALQLLLVDAAFANRGQQLSVPEAITSSGPQSFQIFCMFNADDCKPGGASKIALTQDVLDVLTHVNARVNRAIRPRLDGSIQVWRINPSVGDCKSYAITKRHQLIEAGLPASALRLAYVKTEDGRDHAVLVVKTNRGDLALDNLNRSITTFRDTGYRIVSISSADPKRWS